MLRLSKLKVRVHDTAQHVGELRMDRVADPEADALTARLGCLCWRPGGSRIYLTRETVYTSFDYEVD